MRKIVWETQFLDKNNNDNLEDQDEDVDFLEDHEIDDPFPEKEIQDVMSTPFGIFRIDHKLNPYYNYKFYVGHTNFDITEEVADMIEKHPGVEVLKIISRYRFIIATGKAFDSGLVRKGIENLFSDDAPYIHDIMAVVNTIEDEYYKDFILTLISDMDIYYTSWVLFTKSEPEFDHDLIGYKQGDDEDKYLEEVSEFKKKYAGQGLLFEKP